MEEPDVTPEQKRELNRLKKDCPKIEEVYVAIEEYKKSMSQKARDVIFAYFYPLSLAKAWEFFPNEQDFDNDELARDAALDNMERWLEDILGFDKDVAKISPYFNVATKRNLVDFLRVYKNNHPQVFYGYEEEWTDDTTGEEHPPTHKTSEVYNDVYDYPHSGIDYDDPERQALREEEEALLVLRLRDIRDKLTRGDQQVLDLLLQDCDSGEIEKRLHRSMESVRQSIYRIRGTVSAP